ncbi:MAG: hypothetical protein LBC40_03595 [Dysgonamonadaceae bacterium]|jgi:hypothetical protein|nr:hypothetical protein [Dysgonamonadaceae bacterium]
MKRKNICILLFAGLLLVGGNTTVSAQKWLDKALKKVDNALNEVDKALNTGTQQQAAPDSAAVKKPATPTQSQIQPQPPAQTRVNVPQEKEAPAKPVIPIVTDWEKNKLLGRVKSMTEKEVSLSNGKTYTTTSTSVFNGQGMLLTYTGNCGTAAYTYNDYSQPVQVKITLLTTNMGWGFAGDHYSKSGVRTFKYDNNGRLAENAFGDTKTLYYYNDRHQVEKKEVIWGTSSFVYYNYDDNGRVVAEYFGEITEPPTNAYAYNAKGQLTSLKENGFEIEKHQYNEKGDVTRDETTSYDGSKYIVTYTYLYNPEGKWTKCTGRNLGKIMAVDTRTYDSKGNWIEQISKNAAGKTLKTVTRTIEYYPE